MKLDPNKIYNEILKDVDDSEVSLRSLFYGSVNGGNSNLGLIEISHNDLKVYSVVKTDLNNPEDRNYITGIANPLKYDREHYCDELYDNLTEAILRVMEVTQKAFCSCEELDKSDKKKLTKNYKIDDLDLGLNAKKE